MFQQTAEISTLLSDSSEHGHGSTLRHKDFSSYYLCRATFLLLFLTPSTFEIPLHWRSLNSSTCHNTLWAVISSWVQVLKRVNCAAGEVKGVHSPSPCSAWEAEKFLQCSSKSESSKLLEMFQFVICLAHKLAAQYPSLFTTLFTILYTRATDPAVPSPRFHGSFQSCVWHTGSLAQRW